MATVKIATLVIRTLARPLASRIKTQAREHERFREFCMDLAQRMHRTEINLRTNILGEPPRQIRPLSETRAVENGANFLAEGFLFSVAVAIIIGETWRSSRSQAKRRDTVDDQLEDLSQRVVELTEKVNGLEQKWGDEIAGIRERNDELTRVLERIIWIGLRGGWTDVHSDNWQQELTSIARAPLAIEESRPNDASNSNANS